MLYYDTLMPEDVSLEFDVEETNVNTYAHKTFPFELQGISETIMF